jgi:hypothetical protein
VSSSPSTRDDGLSFLLKAVVLGESKGCVLLTHFDATTVMSFGGK